jgi:hypothetical protein
MPNMLHRLLRRRRAAEPETAEPEVAAPEAVEPEAVEPEAAEPEAAAEPEVAPTQDPTRFEARPGTGRRRWKSSEETSTIGPGDPA